MLRSVLAVRELFTLRSVLALLAELACRLTPYGTPGNACPGGGPPGGGGIAVVGGDEAEDRHGPVRWGEMGEGIVRKSLWWGEGVPKEGCDVELAGRGKASRLRRGFGFWRVLEVVECFLEDEEVVLLDLLAPFVLCFPPRRAPLPITSLSEVSVASLSSSSEDEDSERERMLFCCRFEFENTLRLDVPVVLLESLTRLVASQFCPPLPPAPR